MIGTAYIDIGYYYGRYGGEFSENISEELLERASEAVDVLCGCKISERGFENFSDTEQEHIRLAAAAAARYFDRNGTDSFGGAEFSPVQMTLGKFSYRTGYYGSGKTEKRAFPESVTAHLEAAGLLYRGACVIQ